MIGLTLFKASKMDSGLEGCNNMARNLLVSYVLGVEFSTCWNPVSTERDGQDIASVLLYSSTGRC